MADLQLVNENGSIVAKDPETGETRPVSLGDVDAGEVNNTVYCSHHGTDGAAIQAALDKHGATPTVVVIDTIDTAPYVADSSTVPLTIPSNTTLIIREDVKLGDGSDHNLFQNVNWSDDGTDDENIRVVGQGGILDGNRSNQTDRGADGDVETENVLGGGWYQNCVSFMGVVDSEIKGVHVVDGISNGIMIGAVTDVTVDGCVIDNVRSAGIQDHFRRTDLATSTGVKFTGNTVRNSSDGRSSAIYFAGVDSGVVSKNIVRGCDGAFTLTNGDGLGSRDITVEGNVFHSTGAREAARLQAFKDRESTSAEGGNPTANITFCENTVYGEGTAALTGVIVGGNWLEDITISGNSIRTDQTYAVDLQDSDSGASVFPREITVSDNVIVGKVRLESAVNCAVKDNRIKSIGVDVTTPLVRDVAGVSDPDSNEFVGNSIRTSGTSDENIIQVNGSEDKVLGNTVDGLFDVGVDINNGEFVIVDNNTLFSMPRYRRNGTRTVINGRGVNSGDPNSTGQWNGKADDAIFQGAVWIEDTTNNNLYAAVDDGSFAGPL